MKLRLPAMGIVLVLRRENDIEQLRRVALAQRVQIEQLLRVLSSQAAALGALSRSRASAIAALTRRTCCCAHGGAVH